MVLFGHLKLLSLKLIGEVAARNYGERLVVTIDMNIFISMILTVGTRHDWNLNLGSFNLEPSALQPSSYPVIFLH